MANKRELKKEIHFISDELISECIFNSCFVKDADIEKNQAILQKILDMRTEFLSRTNTTNGKNNPKIVKKYYQKLIEDFDKKIAEILEEFAQINN